MYIKLNVSEICFSSKNGQESRSFDNLFAVENSTQSLIEVSIIIINCKINYCKLITLHINPFYSSPSTVTLVFKN